jgi:subtilase family serine protease
VGGTVNALRRAAARRLPGLAWLAAVAVLLGSLAGLPGDLVGAAGGTGTGDHLLGRVRPSERIDITLVLRDRHPQSLRTVLDASGGPIAPGAFGRRFGPSVAALAALREGLAAAGLDVMDEYPQRTALRARGPAGAVERLFGVRLFDLAGPSGRYHVPDRDATIPGWMRGAVSAVAGLSDRPRFRPFHHLGEVPAGLTPDVVSTAYDIEPLRDAGIDGSGQTVAIVSFATVRDGDIASFDSRFDIHGPPVEHVAVLGGTAHKDLEAALDVEVIRGLAPAATILNYEAPNGRASIGDVVDAIVADGRAGVISVSWGFCDAAPNRPEQSRDERSFEAAAAAGVTIFVASGDAGAFDCQRQDPGIEDPTVDWPSASPSVVSVGGTRLFLTNGGGYARETGWEDVLSRGGSGGGLAPDWDRPTWQRAPGVDQPASNGRRQIPDVAGPADPDSGFDVVATGPDGFGTYQVGGTSAAAPFWAASAALVLEDAEAKGIRQPGFLGPSLYQIAAGVEGATATAFHDVTVGRNRLFACGPGWDFATGLGSPDVAKLADAFVALQRAGGTG